MSEILEIEQLQKLRRRAVEEGPPGDILARYGADQAAIQKRIYDPIHIHAADGLDFRPSDGLPIGNDRQGLEGGSSHARRPATEQHFFPIRMYFLPPPLATSAAPAQPK